VGENLAQITLSPFERGLLPYFTSNLITKATTSIFNKKSTVMISKETHDQQVKILLKEAKNSLKDQRILENILP